MSRGSLIGVILKSKSKVDSVALWVCMLKELLKSYFMLNRIDPQSEAFRINKRIMCNYLMVSR